MRVVVQTLVFVFIAFAATSSAQNNDPFPFPDRDRRRGDDDSKIVKEMLSKQQSAREKKEYEELIDRGEAALALSEALEQSFAKSERITPEEARKLVELEKLVEKIRDDLGGDDDSDEELPPAEKRPKDVREGFIVLKNSTERLVNELKKTTRFSISIVAIESSNALIKVVRFLRLRS